MKEKTLIITVTRNNPVMLQNLFQSIEKCDSGSPYEILIADNQSTDPKQLQVLDKLSKKYSVETCENNRVEIAFDNLSKRHIDEYRHFLFLHDDTFMFKNDWLKVAVDRLQSKYCEQIVSNTHFSVYPVGIVCFSHQPWRDFEKCMGYPLHSFFLQRALSVYEKDTFIYKYGDQDRSLWSQECLKKSGMWHVARFKEMEGTEIFTKLTEALRDTLQYPDEGIPPKDKYPPGFYWNKFTLLSEFFNSVWPLTCGYRTVGLEGDGFLEQVDGFDIPWGNNYICHLGMPNVKKWLGKKFNCDPEEVSKQFNSLPFLVKCDKLIKEFYK